MSGIFNGQKIQYDPDFNTILTSIRKPFYSAGKVLDWKEKIAGIGINNKIIIEVLKRRANLRVKIDSNGDTYFIAFDILYAVLNKLDEKANYRVKGNRLKVIPLNEFVKVKV